MRRYWTILMAGAVLGAAPAANAQQPRGNVDPVVAEAMAAQAAGNARRAYELLRPLTDARAGDADFDYALGLAAADSSHPGEAIAAFQRVLAEQPGNAQARAELARVYAMAGDIDTAKATFDTVLADPTVPDPVRQRLNRLVRDYDRRIRGGGGALGGFADAEVGYDSNVNTATSLTSITLPVFAFLGPASLTGAATRGHDGYYQLQAGLTGSTALSRQTRVYASALGSWRDNFGSDAFDQAAATGTAGIAHTAAGGDVASVSGQVQRFWLGRDGYRTSIGAIGQYSFRLNEGRALSVQAQYYRFNYDNDALRDADRFAGTLTYAGRIAFAGIGGGTERTVRGGARHLGFAFGAVQAGTEYPLAANLALLVGASAEHRDYHGADPLFLRGRIDTQLDATFGVRVALGHGISLRPRATYTRNFSNIGLYDYSRFTVAMGGRVEF